MNLIIDAGNSYVKLAVFDGGAVVFDASVSYDKFAAQVKNIFQSYSKIKHAIVASVGALSKKNVAVVAVFCKIHVVDDATKTPFINLYGTPETLGVDRMALATAAYYNKAKSNVLVLDAGTCLTYDFINSKGEYLGGAISPGINMRFKALHSQTSKLPLLEKNNFFELIGNSTETSMQSGVLNGFCAEIDGVIDQYKSRFTDLTVILTGGDCQFLSKRLKNTIFVNSKFLLEGLNYLLEYNKK